MWWMAAMSAVKAIAGQRAAKAQEALGAARAKYENAIRDGRNQLAGAEAAIANVAQGIGNRRRLDAAGANLARAGEALGRAQEAASANRFSRRVRAAEAAGEAVAIAAFSGVTGGSAQTVVETAALRRDMVEEVAGRQQAQNEYELRKNASEQLASGIAGLDQRLIRPNLDLGVSVNQAPRAGSLLEALVPVGLNNLSGIASAVGGFFGGRATLNPTSNSLRGEGDI